MSKYVLIDRVTNVTEDPGCQEPHEHEYCDRGATRTMHNIQGLRLVSGRGYYDADSAIDLAPGLTYWLVYILYETGDSFGQDCGEIEIVDVYNTYDEAMTARREALAVEDGQFSYTYTNGLGVPEQTHVPWTGYFKRLESVEIEHVVVAR